MVSILNNHMMQLRRLALLGLVASFCWPICGNAELLDDLCMMDSNATVKIKPLVEEAEATGMPASTLNRLLVKGYQDQASVKTLGRLLCIVVRAEEEGLPPDLLFEKLDEGLGKRASLAHIASVVANKVDDMKFARSLLSETAEPKAEDDNVTRIANVLATGISRLRLEALFRRNSLAPVQMRVIASEIMAYGRVVGYDRQLLSQVVKAGMTYQAFTDEWAYFVKVISKARRKDLSDRYVAKEAIKTLSGKETLDSLIVNLGMNPREIY